MQKDLCNVLFYLVKFKSDIHKKSPYYYHKFHFTQNSIEFKHLLDLDETYFRSANITEIPYIN